jgi:hypothetical protein
MTEHQERIAEIRERLAAVANELPVLPGDFGFTKPALNEFFASAPYMIDTLLAQLDAAQADTHEGLKADRWKIVGSGRADGLMDHTVQTRVQRDGSVLYVISDGVAVMARDGEWQIEPIPSSRTDAFIANTRFASIAEAMKVYRAGVSPEATEGTNG